MKTFKKIISTGAILLMTSSMGQAYAGEGEISQTRTQERVRTESNLQTPGSDVTQSPNREEHTVMNKNQYQHQYRYKNNFQNEYVNLDEYLKKDDSAMNRMNTTNRSMQGSAVTGHLNRQSTASRIMSGGRH